MELMVYIAIMGIIVIVAGQAFSNSTKFRVRNQSMIEANEVAGNIASLIRDDIAQMGAKSSLETKGTSGASDEFSEIPDEIYMPPVSSASTGSATSTASNASTSDEAAPDSSSFALLNAGNKSDLRFRRIHYGSDGKYQSIEEVRWFLDGDVLKRSCWTVKKQGSAALDASCSETSADKAVTVEIADGVSGFGIVAGKPSVNEGDAQMFPDKDDDGDIFALIPRFDAEHYNYLTISNNGTNSVLSGFAQNFDKANNRANNASSSTSSSASEMEINQVYATSGLPSEGAKIEASTWKNFCQQNKNHFTFEPNMVYEISFELAPPAAKNKMEMFRPGSDHLSVGFRDAAGERIAGLADFLFYPPISEATQAPKRTMRFSVREAVKNACMEFTFATYSPVISDGILTIQNLKLKKLATASYDFTTWNTENAGNIAEKKNVKAFKLNLSIKVNGEEGISEEIIGVPSNGPRD